MEESEWGAVLSCQQLDCCETLLTTALLPSGSDSASGVLRKCIIFIEMLKKKNFEMQWGVIEQQVLSWCYDLRAMFTQAFKKYFDIQLTPQPS